MSSFRTKAFVAIFTIVALMFGPYAAMAQNSWTPPTEAPTGGNVPPPINEGPLLQRKQGPLDIQGLFRSQYSSQLSGETVIQPDTNNAGFLANFLESFFYGDVSVGDGTPFNGSGNEIPADLSVYGKFKYQTADSNGNPEPVYPGYVLTTNDEGYTEWVDPSTITGDPGSLPSADEQGATLYWDIATNAWKVANNVKINQDAATGFSASGPLGSLKVNNQGLTTVDGALRVTLDYAPDSTGKVLKAMDGTGLVTWGSALADGGNDGDVLTWNSTTNQWESTTINIGSGNLPSTATIGDTLRWNGTIWDKTSLWQVGTATQPNRAGTGAGVEQLTLTTNMSPTSFVSISSPTVRILPIGSSPVPGYIMTANDFTGKVVWSDPASLTNSIMPPGTNNYTMRYNADLPGWEQTNQIMIDDDDGSIYIDNNEAGTGRFMNSVDDSGKVNWNKYFVYDEDEYVPGMFLDKIVIPELNETGRNSAFANYGIMTYLDKDLKVNGYSTFSGPVEIDADSSLRVQDTNVNLVGDARLFLEELPQEIFSTDNLVHVCWNTETGRISKCTAITGSGGGFEENDSEITVTYVPQDNGEFIEFSQDATLDITWCGAGGGGGGGGIGSPGENNVTGMGAGGGGGGEAGECESGTFDFNAGQILSWNIGSGGQGGGGGNASCSPFCQSSTSNLASSGETGDPTYLLLNNAEFNAPAFAGNGGAFGCSGTQATAWPGPGGTDDPLPCYNTGQVPNGGNGGNIGDDTDWDTYNRWWHNGQTGFHSAYSGNDGGGGGPGYGGMGGDGESPVGANPSLAQGSSGGGGGWSTLAPDPFTTEFYGGDGKDAIVNYGGGGGGGSFGRLLEPVMITGGNLLKGGKGGDGGDGYIRITGPANVLNNINTPDEVIYNTPGTYTFDVGVMSDNQQTYTVELWGGGGGGAPVSYNPSVDGTIKGGGGGAGSYVRKDYNLTPSEIACISGTAGVNNCPIDYTVTVGAGGVLGVSAQTPGAVTPATAGGMSRFCMSPNCAPSYLDPRANGGSPGGVSNGGLGGVAANTSGVQQFQNGTAGQSAAAGGIGGSGYQGVGKGGNGAVVVTEGGFVNPQSATNGAPGRVRISWD